MPGQEDAGLPEIWFQGRGARPARRRESGKEHRPQKKPATRKTKLRKTQSQGRCLAAGYYIKGNE